MYVQWSEKSLPPRRLPADQEQDTGRSQADQEAFQDPHHEACPAEQLRGGEDALPHLRGVLLVDHVT